MSRHENPSVDALSIQFWGAVDGKTTGSCYEVRNGDTKMLVDRGMFQGPDEEDERGVRSNWIRTEEYAKGVSQLWVSHGHNDHYGLIPKMYRDGYKPPVMTTEETAIIMKLMLADSVRIQARENPENRLFEQRDVDEVMANVRIVKPFQEIVVGDNLRAAFWPNGHIVGSAMIDVIPGGNRDILFFGDAGRRHQEISGGWGDVPKYPTNPIRTMVLDATNFEKTPVTFEARQAEMLSGIKDTWKEGGNPIFAVLSTREPQIVEILHNWQESGEIPDDVIIVIDAPLAEQYGVLLNQMKLTNRFGDNPNFYNEETGPRRFDLKNVVMIDTHEDSLAADKFYANYKGRAILIASGGMGRGRITNYRKHFLNNPKNALFYTSYQVTDTDGAKDVAAAMTGSTERTVARVHQIMGFSGHYTGKNELEGLLRKINTGKVEQIFITHAKDKSREALAQTFVDWGYADRATIHLPVMGQVFGL